VPARLPAWHSCCTAPLGVTEEKLNEELNTMLQELRVALPGMQMLFAFLLTIPFNQGFEKVTALQKAVFVTDLAATALSSIFLIAPSVYHRLHWRRDVDDKDRMLHVFNVLAICGGAFLSVAIVASMFLIIDFLFGRPLSWVAAATTAAVCVVVWYVLPLSRRARETRKERHGQSRPARAV
jgi:hypothetical protein